jgi:hypothetical protein
MKQNIVQEKLCEGFMKDMKHVTSELQVRPSGTVSPKEKTITPAWKAFCGQVLKIRKL